MEGGKYISRWVRYHMLMRGFQKFSISSLLGECLPPVATPILPMLHSRQATLRGTEAGDAAPDRHIAFGFRKAPEPLWLL